MILKDDLRKIMLSQREELNFLDVGVPREKIKAIELGLPYAIILTGVRRCGKSTLLKQLTMKVKTFYYFNFEDPRLASFEASDFHSLMRFLRRNTDLLIIIFLMRYKTFLNGKNLFVQFMIAAGIIFI